MKIRLSVSQLIYENFGRGREVDHFSGSPKGNEGADTDLMFQFFLPNWDKKSQNNALVRSSKLKNCIFKSSVLKTPQIWTVVRKIHWEPHITPGPRANRLLLLAPYHFLCSILILWLRSCPTNCNGQITLSYCPYLVLRWAKYYSWQ